MEMGNTGSVEIVFSLLGESSYMQGRLSWLSVVALVSLFIPSQKSTLSP